MKMNSLKYKRQIVLEIGFNELGRSQDIVSTALYTNIAAQTRNLKVLVNYIVLLSKILSDNGIIIKTPCNKVYIMNSNTLPNNNSKTLPNNKSKKL